MADNVDDINLDDIDSGDDEGTLISPELLDEPIGNLDGPVPFEETQNQFEEAAPEITDETSKLASTPGKNIIIFALLGIVSLVIIYNVIFQEDEEASRQEKVQEIIASQPIEQAVEATRPEGEQDLEVGVIDTPELPDIPEIESPELDFETPTDTGEGIEPFAGFEPSFLEELEQVDSPEIPTAPPTDIAEPGVTAPVAPPAAAPTVVAPGQVAARPGTPAAQDSVKPIEPTGPTEQQIAARKAQIRKSSGFVMNSGQGLPSNLLSRRVDKDGKPVTSNVTLTHTGAEQVAATNIGETDYIIAQGKIIEAVLETAIHTNLPGMLRAVISRDIYAESGNNILIPKGSRLVGTYNDGISEGDTRVAIQWQRVIRPDGIDIAIDSPSTDRLGRAGTAGYVDTKYWDVFSNAVLLSLISIGSTLALDELDKTGNTSSSSTVNNDGSTTTSQSGTPIDFAVLESVTDLSDTAENLTERLLDQDPVIIVNQGVKINVFVNKDLVFPKNAVYGQPKVR